MLIHVIYKYVQIRHEYSMIYIIVRTISSIILYIYLLINFFIFIILILNYRFRVKLIGWKSNQQLYLCDALWCHHQSRSKYTHITVTPIFSVIICSLKFKLFFLNHYPLKRKPRVINHLWWHCTYINVRYLCC